MKKLLLLLTLFCVMFSTVKAEELTVASGTSTSSYVPITGTWVDTQGTQGQCLYPADSLSDMNGGVISQLTFYLSSPAGEAWTSTIKVRIGEISDGALTTTFVAETNLTEVFSGQMDATGTELTVEFSEGYTYSGGNLLVDFYVASSGNYKSATFYGVNNITASGHYAYSSYNTVTAFLPKATFEYAAGGSAGDPCEKPSSLLAENIGSKTASLSWADGSGVYNVELKKGSEDWQPLLTGTTEFSHELTGLTPNTAYQARVQSVCAGNEENPASGWKTVSFTTLIGIPYLQEFATYSQPDGWGRYSGLLSDVMAGTALTTTTSGWNFSTGNAVFNNHAKVNVYYSSYSPVKYWLVSPEILMESNNLQLTFDLALTKYSGDAQPVAAGSQADHKFVVLATTDGGTTWQILRQWDNAGSEDVYDNIATTGEEISINLSDFAGENVKIAFYVEVGTSSGDNNLHIDNVLIDYIPRCLTPTSLAAGSVGQNSAEISWTAGSGEEAWILQYKKSTESAWQSIEVTENPYLMEGLDTYTAYDVQIAAHCDDLDEFGTSKFSSPISFKTVAGIPFVENFDSSLPSDWKQYTGLLDEYDPEENPLTPATSGWSVGAANGVFTETDNHLYCNIYGASRKNWLVSPAIAISGNVQLEFDLALTKYEGTQAQVESGMQDDDKFIVLYSLDNGVSWEELKRWDNESSAQAYDAISYQGQTERINLSEFDGESMRFAFYGESTVEGGDNNLHIDNFKIDEIPDCEKPTDVAYSNLSDTAVTFSWAEVDDVTWQFGIIANPADEIEVTEDMFTGSGAENSITIDTLHENSLYAFIVRKNCGGATSEAVIRRFTTHQHAAELPFTDDFEDGNGWLFVNGSLTNAWAYGEAATESGHAIYVSNDGGTTNAYNASSNAVVYAVKLFHIAADGTYSVQFDWKANGDSYDYDYLRAAIVPADVVLEASTYAPSGLSTTSLPEGWIAIDRGSKLNLSSTWKSQSAEVDLEEGTYNVVFVWVNNAYYGANPPAAIDNFSFSLMECPAPGSLEADPEQITSTSISLTWKEKGSATAWKIRYKKSTASDWTMVADPITEAEYVLSGLETATTYQIQVASWCDPEDEEGISTYCDAISVSTLCDVISSFPWSENFNNLTSGIPLCWNNDEGTTTSSSSKWSYYNTGHDGACLRFDSYINSTDNDNYLATPEINLTNNSTLSFWCKNPYGGDFDVYIEKDGEDRELLLGGLTSISDWTLKEINLSAYTGSQVIIYFYGKSNYGNGDAYLYLDDVMIEEIPDCLKPTGLKVVEFGADTATLAWDALENGAWKYAIAEAGVVPADEAYEAITDTFKIVEGLESSTAYTFYLRRDCETSVSPAISVSFQTLQMPVAVPFADDFEDGNKWFFINGTQTNAWVHGEAAHNGEGTHALYISNDNGVSNAYATSSNAVTYAVKKFTFAQGTYSFKYDYLADGEYWSGSPCDYMRVLLAPASVELSAGSLFSGLSATAKPQDWYALDGGTAFCQVSEWQTYESSEIAIPEGEYMLVLVWRNDGSSGSNPPAAFDNFSISKVACAKQTALTIDAITATTATLSWTAGDAEQSAWEIAIDTIAGFDPDTLSVLLDAASNPYIFQNLEPETRYYVYIRANCGDEVHSAWSAVANFTTSSACETPSGLKASEITSSTATISWNTYGLDEFNLRYSDDGTNWVTVEAIAMPYIIEDMAPNASYRVQVQAACNTEAWSTALNFKTACEAMATMPLENFDGITGSTSSHVMPDCWSYINTSSYSYYNYYPTVYNSSYSSYSGANYLRFYSYYSSSYSYYDPQDQYAILPAMTNVSGLRMRLQARKYESYYDATVIAGVMSDPTDAATFVAIDTISPASTSYSEFVVMFNTYEGAGQYIALKMLAADAQSTSRSVYIEDVEVELIPNCLEPTAPAVSEIGARTAVLDWTSDAAAWQICLNDDESNLIDANAKPFVLEGLTPETVYSVKVRAICADEEESAWSNSISFATLVACPAPTALKAILTPGNGSIATLQWTAGAEEEAWVIEYDTDAAFANAIDSAVVEPTIDLIGLVAEQTYYARVKAVCGEEDGESVWSAVVSFVPTDAYELTVNDGTSSNEYVPLYGYYADYGSWSQFIIPAEVLASINGDTIQKLTFFASNMSISWGIAEYAVYMSEVEETTIADFYNWSDLTQVMDPVGLSIDNNEMEVVLDDPYKYQGGNLLIGFYQTTINGSYNRAYWYGIDSEDASYMEYGSSHYDVAPDFLPKMKINFAKSGDVPGPGEGIFNTSADGKAVKFIRNNQVYILVNGVVYNITGQKVEVK